MPRTFTEAEARQYSPLTLAFLGDSVYEIMVRQAVTERANAPVRALHQEKIRYVCAAFQAGAADRLLPSLTEAEAAIFRRARNASLSPPKNADPADYRRATGLEAVFGYLQLTAQFSRISELFDSIWEMRDEISQEKE